MVRFQGGLPRRSQTQSTCVGQRVEVRAEVDGDRLEVRWAGQVVATHHLPAAGVTEVWDGEHWAATQALALGERPRLHLVGERPAAEPERQCRIELALDGDFDVDPVDLGRYNVGGEAGW